METASHPAFGKTMNMERLIFVRLDQATPHREWLFAQIGLEARDKALRYRKAEDQIRSMVASYLIQCYVGEGKLLVASRGKPSIEGKRKFNISHAGNFIGIYVSDEEVGLDIEEVSRCSMEIVGGAFTPIEALGVHDQESFALAWTRKEAVTKCLGTGIENPTSLGLVPEGDAFLYREKKYHVHSFFLEGHAVSLAKEKQGGFPNLEIVAIDDE